MTLGTRALKKSTEMTYADGSPGQRSDQAAGGATGVRGGTDRRRTVALGLRAGLEEAKAWWTCLDPVLAVCPRATGPAVVVVVRAGPFSPSVPRPDGVALPAVVPFAAGSRYACPTSLHGLWRALWVGRRAGGNDGPLGEGHLCQNSAILDYGVVLS